MDFRLIRHLYYFKAVADERHFGRAAKRLGISQPPLSQQIKTLESNLGFALFERSRQGVTLTPEGVHILPAVEKLLDESEMLDLVTIEAGQGKTRRLNIGAIAFSMAGILPKIIRAMRAEMPETSLIISEFDSNEALDALEQEEIDVAFLRAEESAAPLNVVPLHRDQLVLAVADDYELADQNSVELNRLGREPMVYCPREISPSYFDRIMQICRTRGLMPRMSIKARSIASQLSFVACGVGVALVPELVQNENLSNVRFIPIKGDTSIVTLAIAWREGDNNPKVSEFVDLVLAMQ